jgi:hypothetical protein
MNTFEGIYTDFVSLDAEGRKMKPPKKLTAPPNKKPQKAA